MSDQRVADATRKPLVAVGRSTLRESCLTYSMHGSDLSNWLWRPTYAGFTMACAVFWAILWVFMLALASRRSIHVLAYVFLGWVIGFFVAALGRLVYPAPKSTLLERRTRS